MRIAGLTALSLIFISAILTACWDHSRNIFSEAQRLDTDSLQNLGASHYSAGRLDSAIGYFSIIAARYGEKSPMEDRMKSAHAYNDCGICYFMLGNYPRAYNAFTNAARLGNEDMKVMVNNNIASIYHYFNDKEKALTFLDKAFNGALKTKNWDALYSSGLNIMNNNYDSGKWDDIRGVTKKLRGAGAPETKFTRYVDVTAEGMGYAADGDIRRAISRFKDAAGQSDSLLDATRYRIASYENIVQTFLKVNEIDSAIFYTDRIVELAEETGQIEAIMNDYELLSHCYKVKGDRERELDYKLKGINIRDSIFSAKEYGKILDFQSAYDIDNIEKKLAESEYQRKIREVIIWFSVVMLLGAIISIVWIIRQNRRLRQTLASLYEKAKKAAESTAPAESLPETAVGEEHPAENQDAPAPEMPPENAREVKTGLLDADKARELKGKIEEVMNSERPWLASDFSLQDLSRAVGSNAKYVSYVLNRLVGKTFSEYVNEYRVMEACRRFSDSANSNVTIESIGNSVGFKSRSSFTPAFKKVTGLSPKDYLAMAKNDRTKG